MAEHRLTRHIIATEQALRDRIGEPTEIVRAKVSDRLNDLTRQLVEHSPFLCLASCDERGNCDVSPRGDPRGFVRILDEKTLLIPERPGNRIADSLRNILRNPRVGLLFFIPGVNDTLRINGRATLISDPVLLEPCAVEGKVPTLGIVVDIESAFTHCAKAFLRAQFWDSTLFFDRSALPSNGAIMKAVNGEDFDAERYDLERAARYARREGFY